MISSGSLVLDEALPANPASDDRLRFTRPLALRLALTDQVYHAETDTWRSTLTRTGLSQYRPTTTWWVQAYGNMLQLYTYRGTGGQKPLDAFRKGAAFWMDHFVDEPLYPSRSRPPTRSWRRSRLRHGATPSAAASPPLQLEEPHSAPVRVIVTDSTGAARERRASSRNTLRDPGDQIAATEPPSTR